MIDNGARMGERAARRVRWRERIFALAARGVRPSEPDVGRWQAGALILLYHRVLEHDEGTGDPFAVSRARFEEQLDWLTVRFRLATVGALAERYLAGQSLAGWAAISFDDGYEDTVQRAWPALSERNTSATLFVDTARLESQRPALQGAEVRALADAGLEIGAHSVTHRDLTRLNDASLEAELRRSRAVLEEITGRPVFGFAHPFGRYDRRVRDATRLAGYRYACSCRQHGTNQLGDDLFGLKRQEVNGTDDLPRFTGKVQGAYARLYTAWYRLSPSTRWWLTET